MMMCLQALGHDVDEDEVNKVMGARPMKGASWEQALACAQHYGVRATLTTPSTVQQLKEWTDAGKPVMIAWNPEDREWSHASVVFDVDDDLNVYVADPNIPDPDETVRVMPKSEFYKKWYEKWPNYLVRRPALMLDREITPDGRQVMASRYGLYVVDKKKGVVLQGAPDRGLGEEDLWLWIDEVSEESQRHLHGRGQNPRKTLTVMTTKGVVDKWGKIKWAPKRRQDPGGVVGDLRRGDPLPRKAMTSTKASPTRLATAYLIKTASHPFLGNKDHSVWSGRGKPSREELKEIEGMQWQDWTTHPLPEGLSHYFKTVPGAVTVPLGQLTPIRAREKGVANANRFMWLAYWGAKDRRKPISLRQNRDGTYTVLDGNSTFANAKMSGWKHLLGVVEEVE